MNWYELSTEHNWETWPVSMEIINDFESNAVTVRFSSSTVDLECVYNDTFESESDLVMGWNSDPGSGDEVIVNAVTIRSFVYFLTSW